jgi:lysophospholipase L1-like esterase
VKRFSTLPLLALVTVMPARADGPLIASMDDLRFNVPKEKAKAELVDGKVGKAVKFRFEKDARGTFFTSNIRGTPEWDKAAGFSFWVKGDGSDALGGLEFIYDNDYSVRYDYAFPIKSTEWAKVTVAWSDLVPVLANAKSKPLGGANGNTPAKLSGLWFGKWWYWGEYPACSFAIDEIRLEPAIERDARDLRPDGPPLKRVADKLRAGKPVTVVTMGDSLTDTRHWANRKVVWPGLLKDTLKERFKSDVTVINPAIGGTELRQNLVLIPRWATKAPEPDLVTVCFGGNDWNSGMRREHFYQTCCDAIDRVRRATGGRADVMLMTTVPGAESWETMAELAGAARRAARERNAGLADTEKAFHAAGKDGRNRLYVDDRVHLSPAGHAVVAETVLKAIEAGGN